MYREWEERRADISALLKVSGTKDVALNQTIEQGMKR
jgi:hypothetical protein